VGARTLEWNKALKSGFPISSPVSPPGSRCSPVFGRADSPRDADLLREGELEDVVPCSLVLPGPVRAEAARKALRLECRPRTGLRAGSFEARKPGRLCSVSPSGRSLPERHHRRSRGDSFASYLRAVEPTAPTIDGSSDPPRGGVGGFETPEGTATYEPIKGNPFGGSWERAALCSRRFDQPEPHDQCLFREELEAGAGGTSAGHHLAPIRRADHRKPHLVGSGATDHPSERQGIIPGDRGTDERGDQRQEGNRHREVYGYSRGERSEGCNPKGATGTKQGRKGSRRSARLEAVKNRPSRLPGGGNSGMTCCPVPQASKGKKPQERCQKASAGRRPSSVKLRSGDKAMRGWAQVQRIWAQGMCGNTS
jgi:hypothetical protein